MKKKLITLKGFIRKLKRLRADGKKVVFTNGCFDILHAGHVRYLTKSRAQGDLLVLGLNSDKSVRKIKEKGRPIVPETERAEVLAALEAIDFIILFDDDTPRELITAIKPDILVKGADWKHGQIVGEDVVRANGGKVKRITLVKGRSTTNIIKKVIKVYG